MLCEETAIVGVCKQPDIATGELVESTIKFGKESIEVSNQDSDDEEDMAFNFLGRKKAVAKGPPPVFGRAALARGGARIQLKKKTAALFADSSDSDDSSSNSRSGAP